MKLKRLPFLVGGPAAAFALLIVLALLFFQTESGRGYIADRAGSLLSSGPERQVVFEKIDGFIPFEIRVERLEIKDSDGPWFTGEKLSLRWSPLALLLGKIHVSALTASRIHVDRRPSGAEEKPPGHFSLPRPPSSLPAILVERLEISVLELGERLLGDKAVFSVHGSVSRDDALAGPRFSIAIQRTDGGPNTTAELVATLGGAPLVLDLRAVLQEAPGGLLAGAVNIARGGELRLELEGKGPLETWKGELRAGVENIGLLQASMSVSWADAVSLRLGGHMETASDSPAPQWLFLPGSRTSLALDVRASPSIGVSLDRAAIESPGFTVEASGEYRPESGELHGNLKLDIPDAGAPAFLKLGLTGGSIALQADVVGTVDRPEADLSLTALGLSGGEMKVEELKTALHIAGGAQTVETGRLCRISGKGTAQDVKSLSGKKHPEMSFHWSGEAEVSEKGKAVVHAFTLDGVDSRLRLEGWLDPGSMRASARGGLELKDLKSIAVFTGGDYSGRGFVELNLDSTESAAGVTGTVKGELQGLGGLPDHLKALAGEHLKLTGELALKEKSVLSVPSAQLQGAGFSMRMQGLYNWVDKVVDADLKVILPEIGVLFQKAARPFAGRVETHLRVEGAIDAAKCALNIEGANVVVNGEKIQKIHGRITGENVPASPTGVFSLDVLKGPAKLSLSADYLMEQDRLHLKGLKGNGPGVSLEGSGDCRLSTMMIRGNLDGRFSDLAALGRFLGWELKGSGRLQGRFNELGGMQSVSLKVDGSRVGGSFGDLKELSLSADLENAREFPRGKAEFSLAGLKMRGLSMNSLFIRFSGDGRSAVVATSARGVAGSSFDWEANGSISRTGEQDRLTLSALKGHFGKYPILLTKPWDISGKAGRIHAGSLEVRFGDAGLEAGGQIDGNALNLAGKVNDFPLEMLSLFGLRAVSGKADVICRVSGDASKPKAEMNLRISDVRSRDPSRKDLAPLTVAADAKVEGGRLSIDAKVEGLTQGPAVGELSVPVRFSMRPFDLAVSRDGELKGRAEARGDLQSLTAYLLQEDHKLRGAFLVKLEAKGTLATPDLSGQATVENGHYENWEHGTVLGKISSRLVGRGRRIEIEEFRATDGEAGRVDATGWVELDRERDVPFEIGVTIVDAGLVRQENITARLGGKMDLSGSLTGVSLKGDLTSGPSEVNVAKRTPPAIKKLNVVEIDKKGDVKPGEDGKRAMGAGAVKLDVSLEIPRRLVVLGGGLESEWNGRLRVEGTERAPSVTGKVSCVRGHFDFLDKRFKIVKGDIEFNGMTPPAPTLDILAEARGKDLLARLRISGAALSPEIKLESDPQLPQDEILSGLLFGRKSSEINPVQAARLAQAARVLSGRDGGPGILDRTRKMFGLDQLGFRDAQSKESKGALGIGKYLTDDIYVDIQKDITGQAGRANVQVEIAPNISLEGQAGSDASTGLGINWKHDY